MPIIAELVQKKGERGIRFHEPSQQFLAEVGYHEVCEIHADGTVTEKRVRTTHYLGGVRDRNGHIGLYRSIKADWEGKVAAEKDIANQIVVCDQLLQPHELIDRTMKSLSSAAADDRGIARPRAKQCLDVAVSKTNLDRAMRIMDALVKALQARGFPISITDDEAKGQATVVTVLGERLKIGLSETTDCKKRPPTAEQLARQAQYSWAYPPTIYDYSPSGKLKLSIHTGGYDNLRRNWTDLVHQRIENCLNRFIAALVKVAEREKADRIEAERRARERQEETRRREEEARRVAEEKARVEDLDTRASAWRKSRRLREYIMAVEGAAIQKLGEIDPNSRIGLWISWAKGRADQVDPINDVIRKFDNKQGDQDEVDGMDED